MMMARKRFLSSIRSSCKDGAALDARFSYRHNLGCFEIVPEFLVSEDQFLRARRGRFDLRFDSKNDLLKEQSWLMFSYRGLGMILSRV